MRKTAKVNSNIRCIEMKGKGTDLARETLVNSNIRCIEIASSVCPPTHTLVNSNIRCIEIII